MKIKEICEELKITRPGLYWLIDKHKKKLGKHVSRMPNGRWNIDETAVELLRKIQSHSQRIIIEKEPADPHVAETIKGMQLVIDDLRMKVKKQDLIISQGLYLRNSIDDVLDDYPNLDPQIRRALGQAVSWYNSQTTEKELKKQLRKYGK